MHLDNDQLNALIHRAIQDSLVAPASTSAATSARIADPASLIDHTLLKPVATEDQIRQLCAEARAFRFAAVCVNPVWVPLCAALISGSGVKVCTVVGFPLGADLPEAKAFEAGRCIALGAAEIDMVINIGALKSGQYAVTGAREVVDSNC